MRAACELTLALESVAPFALQPCGANWRTGRHVTAMCGAYSVVRIECSYSVVHIYSVVHMVCAHSTWLTLLSEHCSQHTVHFAVYKCTSEFTNAVAFTECSAHSQSVQCALWHGSQMRLSAIHHHRQRHHHHCHLHHRCSCQHHYHVQKSLLLENPGLKYRKMTEEANRKQVIRWYNEGDTYYNQCQLSDLWRGLMKCNCVRWIRSNEKQVLTTSVRCQTCDTNPCKRESVLDKL